MGRIMLCCKYGRYLQKNPLLASVLLKRFKGSASTTDHTLARGNARPLQVENVSIDSLRSGTDDAKQNIKKLVRATSAELSSFPTDERLPNLCYPEHNFERSNEKRSIGQPTPDTHPHLMQPLEVTPGITKIEYEDRRKRLLSLLANTHAGQSFDKHAVIIMGYPTKIMSADIPFPFHQNSDFLYLSGFQEPDAVLILESQRNLPLPNHNMLLFVKPRDPKREIWDGPVSGLDAAVDFFGASEAFPISSLASVIHERYGNNTHCLWYNLGDNQTNPRIHSDLINMFNGKTFNYPALHSLGHNVQILRLIKSPAEIKLMKKTAEIGARAFSRVMLSSRPGLEESVLHAILEYECKLQGAQRLAFPPVVAGGLSANTLHYVSNAHVIRDGDMILMDAGCEYNGYVSDITRTWPVNGKFIEEQRQLYEIVLRVQAHCIEHCKVGVSLDQLHQRMISSLGSELQRIGFIDSNLTDNVLKRAVAEYCPHHLGHYLGMDTHDTPLIHRGLPLQPGMVITVEPGLYIPGHFYHLPERYRGIGIRIEDDVLITDDGPFVLSAHCPKTVEDIEELLSSRNR